jgi:ABC-type glycerol-3-phosphate transport system substrate-binding protein
MKNLKLKVNNALKEGSFIFAKTMPEIPHEYTTNKKWDDKEFFIEICKYITENGVREKFGKSFYKYYYANDYKYWLMRDIYAKGSYIINRAKLDQGNSESDS